jgi:hypothetical protein
MKKILTPLLATLAMAFAPVAWAQHSQKQIEEDIKRHLAMAEAHQAAAQCLQQGRDYKVCQQELQTACKGLALGRYCGMRHTH